MPVATLFGAVRRNPNANPPRTEPLLERAVYALAPGWQVGALPVRKGYVLDTRLAASMGTNRICREKKSIRGVAGGSWLR